MSKDTESQWSGEGASLKNMGSENKNAVIIASIWQEMAAGPYSKRKVTNEPQCRRPLVLTWNMDIMDYIEEGKCQWCCLF
ncbi:Hypothetical predicted protein [Podarcis lilfordi]|uniref:Uncharacterized protein n=1 Tax=Podarcis lilfordi TaxID=74358 RepID=A0AA35NW45_9SAUR|nr:Hypothetical predicted protein [Podarcis lilfordi]